MNRRALLLAVLLAPLTAQATAPPDVGAALAAPDRPAGDLARDALRKPASVIAFAGIKPGDRVADLMPGKAYYTRIFSHVVGPQGHVYAIVPTELLHVAPKIADDVQALAGHAPYGNVSVLVVPTAEIHAPEPVDVAWTSNNYHDLYGFFGAAKARAFDDAVYRMLRPGGIFMVIDHVARAGTSDTSPTKLHRIDPATVRAQILLAGFQYVGDSDVLRNPADAHDIIVFAPAIRGHTDQFVMKFRKPAA